MLAGMGSWCVVYVSTRHAGAKAVPDIGAGMHLDLSRMYAQGKGVWKFCERDQNEHLAKVVIVLFLFLGYAPNGAQTLAPAGS